MEIIVNKKLILTKFLIPISKFTDQAILTLTKDSISCVSYTTSDKQSVILYTNLEVKSDITEESLQLNIGSVKRLINAFSCILDDVINLTIDNNSLSYTSPTTNFKFHLKEDGLIERPPLSVEKIKTLAFNTEFIITYEKIDEILKASGFSADSNKIYLYLKDGVIYGELTDKTIQNLDSITVNITNAIIGDPIQNTIPLKLDVFKTISSIKANELMVKINNKGVVMFEIKEIGYLLQYITSSLIK